MRLSLPVVGMVSTSHNGSSVWITIVFILVTLTPLWYILASGEDPDPMMFDLPNPVLF